MNLFTIQFKEIEHLPVAERERIVKKCMGSESMVRYKKIAPAVAGILALAPSVGFVYPILARKAPHGILWHVFGFVVISFGFIIFLVIAKVAVEFLLLRTLIRKEVRKTAGLV